MYVCNVQKALVAYIYLLEGFSVIATIIVCSAFLKRFEIIKMKKEYSLK